MTSEDRKGGGRRPPGIVLFSAQDYWYHSRAHSDVQLARGLSTQRRVLLVNSIGMRMPTRSVTTEPIRRVVRKLGSLLRAVRRPEANHPQLFVMTPLIVPLYGSPVGRRFNAWLVRWQVRLVAAALRLGRPDVIVTIPTAWDVVRGMPRRSLTVNRSDRFSSFVEADQAMIAGLEHGMLAAADLAVYVNHELMRDEETLTRGRARFLGHGVDLDRFRLGLTPSPGLRDVDRPIVGFFGGLDDYVVDLSLIERTADALSHGTLVLVGLATCDVSRLQQHPRVLLTGHRDYGEIPGWGAGFDVAIMPWLDNEWIRYCNPIKVKEYLALGLPVVSTTYPEAESYADVMDIAADPADFVELVLDAVRTGGRGTPETRRHFVSADSWLERSLQLDRMITEAVS